MATGSHAKRLRSPVAERKAAARHQARCPAPPIPGRQIQPPRGALRGVAVKIGRASPTPPAHLRAVLRSADAPIGTDTYGLAEGAEAMPHALEPEIATADLLAPPEVRRFAEGTKRRRRENTT